MFTQQNLHLSLSSLGVLDPGEIFDALHAEYTGQGRHYHSDTHVAECLRHLERLRHLALQPEEIEVAIWFHDAIYDTRKNDNEEQSAAWAVRYLDDAGVNPDVVSRVENMILCTKTHVADTEDAELMLDIDLGILGTTQEIFESYDEAIRREYHWVPEADYRKGRTAVLASFLERDTIYKTEVFLDEYEKQARENLQRKISTLSS